MAELAAAAAAVPVPASTPGRAAQADYGGSPFAFTSGAEPALR